MWPLRPSRAWKSIRERYKGRSWECDRRGRRARIASVRKLATPNFPQGQMGPTGEHTSPGDPGGGIRQTLPLWDGGITTRGAARRGASGGRGRGPAGAHRSPCSGRPGTRNRGRRGPAGPRASPCIPPAAGAYLSPIRVEVEVPAGAASEGLDLDLLCWDERESENPLPCAVHPILDRRDHPHCVPHRAFLGCSTAPAATRVLRFRGHRSILLGAALWRSMLPQ